MNIKEFAALRPGDRIENVHTNSTGVVTAVLSDGIRLRWPPSAKEFDYSVASTIWTHWTKIDDPKAS